MRGRPVKSVPTTIDSFAYTLVKKEPKTVPLSQSLVLMLAMNNILTVAELKRRGMAAIEEGLRRGPVHIVKRNKAAAVVLSEEEYQRLIGGQPPRSGMTAVQWLLMQPADGTRDKGDIDASLAQERAW